MGKQAGSRCVSAGPRRHVVPRKAVISALGSAMLESLWHLQQRGSVIGCIHWSQDTPGKEPRARNPGEPKEAAPRFSSGGKPVLYIEIVPGEICGRFFRLLATPVFTRVFFRDAAYRRNEEDHLHCPPSRAVDSCHDARCLFSSHTTRRWRSRRRICVGPF
jgi:hypothetical protein